MYPRWLPVCAFLCGVVDGDVVWPSGSTASSAGYNATPHRATTAVGVATPHRATTAVGVATPHRATRAVATPSSSRQQDVTGAGAHTGSRACGTEGLRKHPWMARIGHWTGSPDPAVTSRRLRWLCGAALVHSSFVVTAAHCVSGAKQIGRKLIVRLGEHDSEHRGGHEVDVDVAKIILHPQYNITTASHHNDLALLRLGRPAPVSSYITAICLPAPQLKLSPRTTVRLAGWGELSFGNSTPAVRLKFSRARVLPFGKCRDTYKPWMVTRFFPGGLGTNKLCTSHALRGPPICKGDSGGPIVYSAPDGRAYLVGVISVGVGCGSPFPSVDTEVAPFVGWLRSTLGIHDIGFGARLGLPPSGRWQRRTVNSAPAGGAGARRHSSFAAPTTAGGVGARRHSSSAAPTRQYSRMRAPPSAIIFTRRRRYRRGRR